MIEDENDKTVNTDEEILNDIIFGPIKPEQPAFSPNNEDESQYESPHSNDEKNEQVLDNFKIETLSADNNNTVEEQEIPIDNTNEETSISVENNQIESSPVSVDTNKTEEQNSLNQEDVKKEEITYEIKKPKHSSYGKRITIHVIKCLIPIWIFLIAFVYYYNISSQISTYTENAHTYYQVCLKENEYYSEKCLGENSEYVTALTSVIRADFNYDVTYQEKVSKNYQYYIDSKIVIKTNDENAREILKKEKKLTDVKKGTLDGNVFNILETVDIPFSEYNLYAQRYMNDYSLLGDAHLIVTLMIKEGKSKKETTSLVIPLNNITYNITKTDVENKVEKYKKYTNKPREYGLIGLMVLAGILELIFLIQLIKFIYNSTRKESKYERSLKKLLNTYDRVIITLEDKNTIVNQNQVYTVKSFLELLDVRDTIDKPILYYKVNDVKTEFYVQDTDKTYKYTMKAADFE